MSREMAHSFEQSVLNSINKHIKSFSGDFQKIKDKLIENKDDGLQSKALSNNVKKQVTKK